MPIAKTPEPPYFAVIFTSQRTEGEKGYGKMADRMEELARDQPGYLGIESAKNSEGFGITVSYWASEEAIVAWKANNEHRGAQSLGRGSWYEGYTVRIAKVGRSYGLPSP